MTARKLRSVRTELVDLLGRRLVAHVLTDGRRVVSLWSLARAVDIEPHRVVTAAVLLPPRLRSQRLSFDRNGAQTPAVPVEWVAELAALDVEDVPHMLRPLWRRAHPTPRQRAAEARS